MKSFKDAKGRVWQLSVNVGTMKRVRALCDIDLYKIIEIGDDGKAPELLTKLAEDPILLVDVLYAICKPEADAINVSDEAFGEGMVGDAIENATNALLDELVDFFPAAKRKVFQKVLLATRRFQAETEKQLETVLADPEFDRKIDSALKRLSATSGSAPASSASTPTA